MPEKPLRKTYVYVVCPSSTRVWGLSPVQRLHRQLASAGVTFVEESTGISKEEGDVLIIRADRVYDTSILKGFLQLQNTFLVEGQEVLAARVPAKRAEEAMRFVEGQQPLPAEAEKVAPEEAAGTYQHMLRKKEKPYCLALKEDNRKKVERRVFMGAYKGVTDIVTKYLWPVPAMWATRLCIRLRLSPNMVTMAGFLLMFAALWYFWKGEYAIGLLAAWIMTFLDTVDGKLARVTFTSSPFGNIFDHGIDLIHPPFWYLAWMYGLEYTAYPLSPVWFDICLWFIFGGYIAGRLVEGYFTRRFGFHIHVWRRFDSRFRLVLARRNPNMIILTLAWLSGREDIGIIVVAGWTMATLAMHIIQLIQAEIQRSKGRKVVSWLAA